MKIPDDVYLNRCQYCRHGRPDKENKEIPDSMLFIHCRAKEAPCGILGISKCCKVPGECLSFTPNPMFGICQYCAFNNSFHDGYCTFPGGPLNKRRVFFGWGGGGYKNDYWVEHTLFTCDHYQVCEYWKDIIMQEVLNGRSPANFDPSTWDALKTMEGTSAVKQWEMLRVEERAKAKAQIEAMEKQRATKAGDNLEQISLF